MSWILPVVILCISLIIIGAILVTKIPYLRVIDVNSVAKERARQIKEQLILQKLQRSGGARVQVLTKASSAIATGVSRAGRRTVQKLYALEQYYQKVKRSASEGHHAYDTETISRLVREAEALIAKDETIPAEKIYIDIISHNPKNIDAYEGLGHLYFSKGQLDQARETLLFALRISPNDASVNVALAEIELASENPKSAVVYLRKAIQKRSKNPKYIDFYIDASLKAGSLKDAQDGITLLRTVNPENQKIAEFEERFEKQKAQYKTKTASAQDEPSQAP